MLRRRSSCYYSRGHQIHRKCHPCYRPVQKRSRVFGIAFREDSSLSVVGRTQNDKHRGKRSLTLDPTYGMFPFISFFTRRFQPGVLQQRIRVRPSFVRLLIPGKPHKSSWPDLQCTRRLNRHAETPSLLSPKLLWIASWIYKTVTHALSYSLEKPLKTNSLPLVGQ